MAKKLRDVKGIFTNGAGWGGVGWKMKRREVRNSKDWLVSCSFVFFIISYHLLGTFFFWFCFFFNFCETKLLSN